MIIIEGPDGAGKTTLVEKLLKHYDFAREGPRGTRDRSLLYTVTVPDTFGAINRAIRATSSPSTTVRRDLCVWDRLYFSEMVYAPIVGRPCEFSTGQQDFIGAILETIGCPIILCLPPVETVKENALAAEQMKGVKENIEGIWRAYDDLYYTMPNQTAVYDYTGQANNRVNLDSIVRGIDAYLEKRAEREWSQK